VCSVQSRVTEGTSLPEAERVPTLLFWDTEGVNYEMYGMWFGPNSFYQCPVECHIERSHDKHELARSEGVVFWSTPLNKGVDIAAKCPKQVWFSASTEAFDIRILDKTPPQGVMADGSPSPIDVEVSWRRGLGEDKVSWLNNFDWNSGESLEAVWSAPEDGPLQPATRTRAGRDEGQAAVAAFISNCGADNGRLELLELLQKYVPVDSFGRCAHNKDVPASWGAGEADTSRGLLTQKNRILQTRYKFLLAFENQDTPDYVTEKFYHPFASNVLPIVLGAPNIAEYAPHLAGSAAPSFLNVRDFGWDKDASPEQKDHAAKRIAAKIHELDQNDDAYLRHFEWRKQAKYQGLFAEAEEHSWLYSPCQVCQKLHQRLYGYKPVHLITPHNEWTKGREHHPQAKHRHAPSHDEL